MLGVEVGYLRNALDGINAKHGSADAYIRDVLGVGEMQRATLRDKLLG
jgi:hypothetical protein